MRIVRYADPTIRYGILEKDGAIQPLLGTPFEGIHRYGKPTHLKNVKLLAPVEPRNTYGVGLNYVKHAQEVNAPLPAVPMLFMKPTSSIVGPEAAIVYPARDNVVIHFEAEVVVVIGRTARRVPESKVGDYILGYTCGNDVSERVVQAAEMKQGCLVLGKSFDTFAPIGPAIQTDLDPGNIAILGRVNGKERQNSNTSDLVYSIPKLVSYLSDAITLHPGDIILTGTPSGIGPVSPGDVVEIEIPEVGVLRNPVVAE